MALTPEVRAAQARTLAVVQAVAPELRVPQVRVLAVYNYPTEQIHVSAARLIGVVKSSITVEVAQARVLAVVSGRIDNYRLRAWTFTLDGHDFYVLRLGQEATLVYDMQTKKWTDWDSRELSFWRAQVGMNWIGMGKTTYDRPFDTNIVAGDDVFGLMWILDPEQGYDDSPYEGGSIHAISRVATGQVPANRRDPIPCFGVYMICSTGAPVIIDATFTLLTSDDDGHTWDNHGQIIVTPDAWDQEFSWLSLGQIMSPGRLFRIEDEGAAFRINSLDMEDPE